MKMKLLYISVALCHLVEFTILYERTLPFELQKVSQYVISKVLEDYNNILTETNIKLRLKSLLPYNEYMSIPGYISFAKLAGSSKLRDRALALENIDTNILVLFSSVNTQMNDDRVNNFSFCKGRYFLNLESLEPLDDVYSAPIKAVKRWMEHLLDTNLPDVYEMSRLNAKSHIDYSKIKKTITGCNIIKNSDVAKKVPDKNKTDLNPIIVVGPMPLRRTDINTGTYINTSQYGLVDGINWSAPSKINNSPEKFIPETPRKQPDAYETISSEISSDDDLSSALT